MEKPRAIPSPPPWHDRLRTVGVTGTNGKTTTTAWIAAALTRHARAQGRGPVARATTVGFFLDDELQADLPKTYDGFVAGMKRCVDRGGAYAAIELTSEALARGFAKAWPCEVGVFTNLTHDHLDAHGNPEHYLASKAQLFLALPRDGAAVLNAADATFELLMEILPEGVARRSYALASRGAIVGEPDLVGTDVKTSWRGTSLACRAAALPAFGGSLTTRGVGDVYAENAMAALLGAVAAGVSPEVAAAAIAEAAPPPGRFEVIHERPYVVVDYAHSPDSLARTVAAARRLVDGGDAGAARGATLTVVFGAGGKRDKAKRAPMGEAARAADHVVLTTDNPRDEDPADIARAIAEGLVGHPSVRVTLDRAQAITEAVQRAAPEDAILIAGKGHETEQTIGATAAAFSDAEIAREALRSR